MLQALRGYQPGTERMRGYCRALEEAGIPFDERLVRPVGFSAKEIVQATHQLLSIPDVTGLLDCSGTQDAASLRAGSARAGRRLGADVDIVVWTYTFNAMLLAEAAAHVWLPVMEASTAGLERLAAQIFEEQTEPFQVLYRPQLYQPPSGGEMPRPQPVFDVSQ
jgi:LacI family transcriptional regulator